MRNLKRALSLALAAAMLISLMVVGASAAEYGDADAVSQTEAVEVLTGIGVVGGDQNGNFNPTATLTRAEYCVMIANALTGGTFDRTLFDGASTPFTDVANHWGAAYIAYCYSNGIIAGTSATTFSPDATLTTAQAAAILLMALGYNQNSEFAANGQFELNVTKWARDAGLYAGLSVSATAGISRENTAKLIFNALTNTTPVGYNTLSEAYYTLGTGALDGIVLSGDKLNPVADSSAEWTNYTRTLGYTNFGLMKEGSPDDDAFGRPTSEWGKDTDKVTPVSIDETITTVADTPVAVFVGKTSANDIATALRGYKFVNGSNEYPVTNASADELNSGVTLATSGVVVSNAPDGTQDTPTFTTNKADQTVAARLADSTKNGRVMEIYADSDKEITAVILIGYAVAEVNDVSTNKDGDVTYVLDGAGSLVDYADEAKDDEIVLAGSIAEDDIVTYVIAEGVAYVYPTTKVVGTQTTYNASKETITVSGTTYTVATYTENEIDSGKVVLTGTTGGFPNTDEDFNYYIDQNGFVVYSDAVKTDSDYAIVDRIALVTTSGTTAGQGVEARLVLADGTVVTVDVSKINGLDTTKSSEVANGTAGFTGTAPNAITKVEMGDDYTQNDALTGLVVTYEVNSDNEYEITYLATAKTSAQGNGSTAAAVISKGDPAIDTSTDDYTGNNNTVYLVKTMDGSDEVFTVYTGFRNVSSVATTTANSASVYVSAAKDGAAAANGDVVDFVYIDATGTTSVGDTETGDIFYVTNKDYTTVGTGSNKYYTLTGILNGEEATIQTKTETEFSSGMTKGELYELKVDNDGYVTDSTVQGSGTAYVETTMTEAMEANNGVIAGYTYDGSETVIVIDDNEVVGGSINSARNGDTIYVKVVDASGTAAEKVAIDVIYIVKA